MVEVEQMTGSSRRKQEEEEQPTVVEVEQRTGSSSRKQEEEEEPTVEVEVEVEQRTGSSRRKQGTPRTHTGLRWRKLGRGEGRIPLSQVESGKWKF